MPRLLDLTLWAALSGAPELVAIAAPAHQVAEVCEDAASRACRDALLGALGKHAAPGGIDPESRAVVEAWTKSELRRAATDWARCSTAPSGREAWPRAAPPSSVSTARW